jgi:hypothetical protein
LIKYNGVENDGRLEEIINPVIENLRSINERNYAFLEVADRKKGVLIYVYLTADNYVVYYKVEDEFEYGITALTDRVKVDVDNGLLFRWNRKRRKYEKADVLKIEKCVLCFFSFLKKRFIEQRKKKVVLNYLLYILRGTVTVKEGDVANIVEKVNKEWR